MTSNVTLKQLCTSQTVFVRYLPDENNKRSKDCNLGEVSIDIEEEQNLMPLQLTPPIVVAWFKSERSASKILKHLLDVACLGHLFILLVEDIVSHFSVTNHQERIA